MTLGGDDVPTRHPAMFVVGVARFVGVVDNFGKFCGALKPRFDC